MPLPTQQNPRWVPGSQQHCWGRSSHVWAPLRALQETSPETQESTPAKCKAAEGGKRSDGREGNDTICKQHWHWGAGGGRGEVEEAELSTQQVPVPQLLVPSLQAAPAAAPPTAPSAHQTSTRLSLCRDSVPWELGFNWSPVPPTWAEPPHRPTGMGCSPAWARCVQKGKTQAPGYSPELARDQAAAKAGWHKMAEGRELPRGMDFGWCRAR